MTDETRAAPLQRYEMPLLTAWQPCDAGRWMLVDDVERALVPLLEALETTRGNIRSLGPACKRIRDREKAARLRAAGLPTNKPWRPKDIDAYRRRKREAKRRQRAAMRPEAKEEMGNGA